MFTALVATTLFLAGADDPPPQPKRVQPRVAPAQPGFGVQPGGPLVNRTSPALLARYEEESEVLEAQLDVKKAYIRAAEVGLAGAKMKLDRMAKLEAQKTVSAEEVMLTKLEVEAAAAQLDIRKAEAREVEVKLKHAKKRVDDGRAPRNAPAPKAIDPQPSK